MSRIRRISFNNQNSSLTNRDVVTRRACRFRRPSTDKIMIMPYWGRWRARNYVMSGGTTALDRNL